MYQVLLKVIPPDMDQTLNFIIAIESIPKLKKKYLLDYLQSGDIIYIDKRTHLVLHHISV